METSKSPNHRKSHVVRRPIEKNVLDEQQQIISDIRRSEIDTDHFDFEAKINATEETSGSNLVQNEKSL